MSKKQFEHVQKLSLEVNEAIKYCPEDCIYWEEV